MVLKLYASNTDEYTENLLHSLSLQVCSEIHLCSSSQRYNSLTETTRFGVSFCISAHNRVPKVTLLWKKITEYVKIHSLELFFFYSSEITLILWTSFSLLFHCLPWLKSQMILRCLAFNSIYIYWDRCLDWV